MEDATLPHSEQQLLDLAWEDINGQIEEYDDRTIESDSDSIHTRPKVDRPGTPYADEPLYLLVSAEDYAEISRWTDREAEGWVDEEHFESTEEF